MSEINMNAPKKALDNSFWSILKEAFWGSNRDFTEGSIVIAIFILAVPMIIEMLAESLFIIVDIFYVAKLGANAVTVVAMTESMMYIVFSVAIGISIAATASVARRIGEKDEDGASRYDLVILDAPATGHGLDMLRVPKVILDVAPPGILRRDAEKAWLLFQDARNCAVVLVTLPEAMPTQETIELAAAIQGELKLPIGKVVVNCVLPPLFSREERAALEGTGMGPDATPRTKDEAAIQVGAMRSARERVQAECLARLSAELPVSPSFLPQLFEDAARPEAIARLRHYLAEGKVELSQKRAAASQHDATIDDIGCEIGGRGLKRGHHRFADGLHGFGQRFGDLSLIDLDLFRDAVQEITAADMHRCATAIVGHARRADGRLDTFGSAFADEQVLLTAQVADDGLVHAVAADTDRAGVDDVSERKDGNLGGATADIDDHVAGRIGDGHAGADGGGDRLGDQTRATGTGRQDRLADGAFFNGCGAVRHADDDLRLLREWRAFVDLADEMLDHFFCRFKVGNDTLAHRTDRFDGARGSAEHELGVFPDGQNLLLAVLDVVGHDRGFVQDDALALDVDESVRRTEVDRHVRRKQPAQKSCHNFLPLSQ